MRPWRVIAGFAATAVVAPILAVAAFQVFLNAGLPVLLNAHPERVRVEYDRAWCWMPGDVDVRGLHVVLHDPAGEWDIAADHVTATIALAPLLDRRLLVSDVRAAGGTVRFTSAPPTPTPPTAPAWSVELDDVVLDHLREVRVDDWRITGDLRATGGLATNGQTSMALRDVAIDLPGADVSLDDAPVASAVEGRATITAHGDPLGAAVSFVQTIDAGLSLHAHVEDLRFLAYYLRDAPWLRIHGGKGTIEAELTLDGGRFAPGSTLRADARDLAADFLSYTIAGDGEVRFGVGDEGAGLTVAFSDYAIRMRGDAVPHVEGKGFLVTARAAEVGLDAPPDVAVVLEIPPSRIRDVSVYNAYLPSRLGFALREGSGTVRGRLRASTATGVATGSLSLVGSRVRATFDDLTITGDFDLEARLRDGRLGTGRYDIAGSRLSLRDVGIVEKGQARPRSERWWADVELPEGKVAVGAPVFLDARLGVQLRDSGPIVSVFSQRAHVPNWIQGLLQVRGLTGTTRVRLGDETLDVPDFTLRGGPYEVLLQLHRRRTDLRGDLFARYGPLSVGVALADDETTVQVLNARAWFEGRRAAAGG